MAAWKTVTFKAPSGMARKAKSKAGKSGLGNYLRRLIAADIGEEPPEPEAGLTGASKATRARVSAAGTAARYPDEK